VGLVVAVSLISFSVTLLVIFLRMVLIGAVFSFVALTQN